MTVVKYPTAAAGDPDTYFCGQCGRRCQPLINDNVGFGPCIDGAASVIECGAFRSAITNSFRVAAQFGRAVHPETAALVARFGVPQAIIDGWIADADRRQSIADYLRRGQYEDVEGGAPFMRALCDWIAEGNADDKIVALIADLKVYCDPTEGGGRPLNMIEITDWFERLGRRAADVLSDPGDWEPGEA